MFCFTMLLFVEFFVCEKSTTTFHFFCPVYLYTPSPSRLLHQKNFLNKMIFFWNKSCGHSLHFLLTLVLLITTILLFLRIKMDFSLYYYTLKKELCLLFLKRVNMMPSFTILLYLAPYVLKNKWIIQIHKQSIGRSLFMWSEIRSDHFMGNEPDPYQIICQKCEPDQINDLDQINFQITPNIKILN